jgi:membrane protease YdiL (CAAX protease family)
MGILTAVGLSSAAQASRGKVLMVLFLLMIVAQGLLGGGVIAMAEEFGWRGCLLQRLMERFGGANRAGQHADVTQGTAARMAALLVGRIHGVWHWPGFFLGFAVANTYPGVPTATEA